LNSKQVNFSLQVRVWALRIKKADESIPVARFHFAGLLDYCFFGVTPKNHLRSLPNIHFAMLGSKRDVGRILSSKSKSTMKLAKKVAEA